MPARLARKSRLISRVSILIEAVGHSFAQLHIDCPLMIVKADGTLALAEPVARRPIEPVLSGPAASLVGAQWLSGLQNFILSDMGGTTTDLGLLLDGRPQITDQGAEVGGWRTMVRAIDVRTIGLGGDSEIHVGPNGKITVGPQRVVPLALLAARYSQILTQLEADLADWGGHRGGGADGHGARGWRRQRPVHVVFHARHPAVRRSRCGDRSRHDVGPSIRARGRDCDGGTDPQVRIRISKQMLLPNAVSDAGLLEAVIVAEAIGRPNAAA